MPIRQPRRKILFHAPATASRLFRVDNKKATRVGGIEMKTEKRFAAGDAQAMYTAMNASKNIMAAPTAGITTGM